MTRTLFDAPAKTKRQPKRCPGKSCRRHIEQAVQKMLKTDPSSEAVGEVLECIGTLAKQLEHRMHD